MRRREQEPSIPSIEVTLRRNGNDVRKGQNSAAKTRQEISRGDVARARQASRPRDAQRMRKLHQACWI